MPEAIRILVVDDDALVRRALVRTLTMSGYAVDSASDAESAIRMAFDGTYGAIVSDVCMPEIDGIGMLRRIRLRDPDLPVVLLSGAPDVTTALAAVELRAHRYLSKPFEPSALRCAVAEAVAFGQSIRKQRAVVEEVESVRSESDRRSAEFGRACSQIWVAYQPIVRATDGCLEAYEALVRTNDPKLASPAALFESAEALGRTADVGRAVRAQCAGPFVTTPSNVALFVNLHTRDLDDPTLYDPRSALGRIASRVVLEITERASLVDVNDVRLRVAKLRQLGYRIAVDDLGAGYAGLTTFALLEPDVVKLDMSLVRDVHRSLTKQRVIGSITRLADELGFVVVAEGVESVEEREVVVDLGCDLLQGFLFARPARAFPEVNWPAARGRDCASPGFVASATSA